MQSPADRFAACVRTVRTPALATAVLLLACAATSGCASAPAAQGEVRQAEPEAAAQQATPPAHDTAAAPDEGSDQEDEGMTAEEMLGQFGVAVTESPSEEELEEADAEYRQPADGEWLVDEETGQQYFLLELDKSEPWQWTDESKTHIRYRHYEVYEVESETEDAFRVRIYRTEETFRPSDRTSPEERAAVDASYQTATGEADLFELHPFDRGLPRRGQWRNGFGVGDMDGDGHLDIVHASPRGAAISPLVIRGDGAGGWSTWQDVSFPEMVYAYGDTRAADLDGDGVQDVVVAMHLNGQVAFRGDGAGNFETWSDGLDYWQPGGAKPPGFSSRALEIVDWNGDGRPDVLALGEGPRPATGGGPGKLLPGSFGVALYLNRGDGSWDKVHEGGDTKLFGESLVSGDFNGDGRPDFATATSTLGLQGILHLGQEDGSWRTVDVGALRPRVYVRGVTSADFDGDGRDDLALTYTGREAGKWRSGIDLLYARPGDTWERVPLQYAEGRAAHYAIDAGDLDGDGRFELVALDDDGGSMIFSQTAAMEWAVETAPEVEQLDRGCRGYHVELVDLDGDGGDEIIEEFAGEPNALIDPTKCRSRGGIRAWTVDRKTPAGGS